MDVHGEGMTLLRRTLAGYARHANFHSALVIGLAARRTRFRLQGGRGLDDGPKLHSYNLQDVGGTGKPWRRGIELVNELLIDANKVQREPVPASHITIGLQCGGSDGYSGISANPALGAAVDLLVAHGGTAILRKRPRSTAPSIC